MEFGDIPIEQAAGCILAHSVIASGVRLKKGHRLTGLDVERLASAGESRVMAARLADGDVHEDEAARHLAALLAGPGLRPAAPFTGRVNIHAAQNGVMVVDVGRLTDLNRIDEAITVATVPSHSRVTAGQLIATAKIIPFAAPAAALARCEAIVDPAGSTARRPAVLSLHPFRRHSVGLIQTALPGTKPALLDKMHDVTLSRLMTIGVDRLQERRCRHGAAPLADEVRQQVAQGCTLILISGASAITDRRDVIPAAVEQAGGTVEHFGMPVDPGNLLLLARLESARILGLPGCARSPALNGFDWVLERLVAGIEVTREDIQAMGVGGLLKEIPSRPAPRSRRPTGAAPAMDALVLAAGKSTRMGARNKLLEPVGPESRPMVVEVVRAALASKARSVTVITGHQAERVRAALEGYDVRFVDAPGYAAGLSWSLAAGIRALPEDAAAALVLLADMPLVGPAQIDRILAAFDPVEGRGIVVPAFAGKWGNPVLWARAYFEAMCGISGDVGAQHLIADNGDAVIEVDMDDDAVHVDIDTPAALRAANSRNAAP